MKRIVFLAFYSITTLQALIAQVDVLMQHNDLSRTGWNNKETSLNISNVNSGTFGRLYTRPVDDDILAQPLVVTGVTIPGVGVKNVVYIATVNNTLYAFDADDPAVTTPYWMINLTPTGPSNKPPDTAYFHPGLCGGIYRDIHCRFGIVGTPVIDKSTNTLYVISRYMDTAIVDNRIYNPPTVNERSYTSAGFYPSIFAIDITTGVVKKSQAITAQANGTGDGNVGGIITFDPRRQFNRSGLVLSNGIIYAAFAAHCDWNPYHGWILGYDATTLAQKVVYISTPSDGRGGIWMSGAAPAVDAAGNLYFNTGNAENANPTIAANRGLSAVKITPNPSAGNAIVSSYFTPFSYVDWNNKDLDFDVQMMLIPNSTLLVTGIKSGFLYIMDQGNLGGFNSGSDNVLSITNVGSQAYMHSSLGYFKSNTTEYIYSASENTHIKAYPLNRSTNSLGASTDNAVNPSCCLAGGFMSTSSNDTISSSAILWLIQADNGCAGNQSTCQGILRALQATNITNELWNSDLNADGPGLWARMSTPTVANGKVYVTSLSKQLAVYGLRSSSCINGPNLALNKPAFASSTEGSTCSTGNCVPAAAFDGNMGTRWSSEYSDPQWLYVDLGQDYDLCAVTIQWEAAYATDFNIELSEDASNWTAVKMVRGNSSTSNLLAISGTGRYVRMNGIHRFRSNAGYSIWEMAVYGQVHNPCSAPTLNNPSNLTENSVTLSWQSVSGASSYNLQYKALTVSYWTTISTSSTSVNLLALTCGQDYSYQVQSVCPGGSSSYAQSGFTTANCSVNCGLPTRYIHADIGSVGQAGSSCYNSSSGMFTEQGSGSGIGGVADAFQFMWTPAIVTSNFFSARIVSQEDAANPNNMIGLMMRDSITPWSRFAYIARTSDNGFVFAYRSVTGGTVTSIPMTVTGSSIPYYVKIQKSGTTYSGYISPNGFTSWTQIGTTVNLNFGADVINTGIAVTSANNGTLSTATVDTYLDDIALPVKFGSLTATDIDDEYIDIRWTTNFEQLNDHFEVLRSRDGIQFEQIATVPGAGTTDIPQSYASQDYHPHQGMNYYRLKQIDKNGVASFSPVVQVKFGRQSGPILYPNPARSFFTVESGQQLVKEVRVLSVSGMETIHLRNAAGWNLLNVPCEKLQAGIYMVQLKTDNQIYQLKLVIQ